MVLGKTYRCGAWRSGQGRRERLLWRKERRASIRGRGRGEGGGEVA